MPISTGVGDAENRHDVSFDTVSDRNTAAEDESAQARTNAVVGDAAERKIGERTAVLVEGCCEAIGTFG
jgi:hypothetical protein